MDRAQNRDRVTGPDRVNRILYLADIAGSAPPGEGLLCEMTAIIAAILDADVASIYVRQRESHDQRLVLRGNVGFPAGAVGRVSLRLGEGLIGFIADCCCPATVAVASGDNHYKHVPGLGEENYPVFLGVPIVDRQQAIAVLALQRRHPSPFCEEDLMVAAGMTSAIRLALERDERRAAAASARQPRRYSAPLLGAAVSPGESLGIASFVPTMSAIRAHRAASTRPDRGSTELYDAIARVKRDLQRARRSLDALPSGADLALEELFLLVDDSRFHARAAGLCDDLGLAGGLERLARQYATACYRATPQPNVDAPMAARAREVEDLCLMVYANATDNSLLPRGGVWIAERVGLLLSLCAAARGAAAIAIEGSAPEHCAGPTILTAARIPAAGGVSGLFAWTRPGDLLAVDGSSGKVQVNPASAHVARIRHGDSAPE